MIKPIQNIDPNHLLFKSFRKSLVVVSLIVLFLLIVLFKWQVTFIELTAGFTVLIISLVLAIIIGGFMLSLRLKKIENEFKSIEESKQSLLEKLDEIQALYDSKEASYQKLLDINYGMNNTALFASISNDGSVGFISKKFIHLLSLNKKDGKLPLEEILSTNLGEQQKIHQLLKESRSSIWLGEVEATTRSDEKLWLEMSIVPMNQTKNNQQMLILCTNITDRIKSQKEIDKLNAQKFKIEVGIQKEQASKIVEAQEEERKRIAKDIHDGIGQMLTALKFNIESINSKNIDSTSEKIEKLKEVLSFLIKEVRTVTFNLTPPELSDYGIVATLNKLANQLSSFTGKKVFFENKTNFNGRFDSLIETNLYRVVQEAVNNALKYADSNYILISINHSNDILSIIIDDDGKGFEKDHLNKNSSMGLFFMKERISYVNGRIFINSVKNKGTRITININLPK